MIWILLILAAIAWIVLNSNKGRYRGKHRRLSNWWDGDSHHRHHNHHHHHHNGHHGGHGGGHGGHH